MDDQNDTIPQSRPEPDEDISLGSGVDIVRGGNDTPDDVEIETYNDDVAFEGSHTPEEKIKELREKLKACRAERQEYLDGWQRIKADFVNYKKREEIEKKEFLKFAREDLISELLPVLESFHMAFANKDAWGKVDEKWRMGVEHIYTQLLQTLAAHGLTEFDPLGEEFDPREHTAIGSVHTDDPTKLHRIAEVAQKGFKLAGKTIRSPQVKVYGDGKESAT